MKVDSAFPSPVPAIIGGANIQTVDARKLHARLEVKSEFRNWIKNRISDFNFEENVDFATTVEIYRGGERRDYHVSLDMAKELCMVERNEAGKAARRYYINCERRALAAAPMIPQSLPEALRLAADLAEDLSAEKAKTAIMTPKAEAFDLIAETDGSFAPTDAAKTLGQPPRQFISWLRMNRWTYRRLGSTDDVAYEDKLKQGLMVHKSTTVPRLDGSEKVVTRARLTPKGLAKLALIFQPMENAA